MMSVQNHRPPLSGNNILWWICCLLCITGCSGPRTATGTKPKPVVETEEKVRVFDPVTGEYVLVPKSSVRTDTIRWTVENEDPIVTDESVILPDAPGDMEEEALRKGPFHFHLFFPFDAPLQLSSDVAVNPKQERFLQYYSGWKMAMEEHQAAMPNLSCTIHDEEDASLNMSQWLDKEHPDQQDILIGPYDKSSMELVAGYAAEHRSYLVSPWLPAFTLPSENPYVIQTNPGLQSHAEAIMKFIEKNFVGRKVYLVARDQANEIARLESFKKVSSLPVEELIVKDKSPELANLEIISLLSEKGTVFILPYFSRSDEAFVNTFLRKVHAEKLEKEVTIFGMPQWVGFGNLTLNYLESLNVHLSVSTYTDPLHERYTSFREKFYQEYHTMPDLQAFLGYDLGIWLLETLREDGIPGLTDMTPEETTEGIASGFRIEPVYVSGHQPGTLSYYENKYIRMVRFAEHDFHLQPLH